MFLFWKEPFKGLWETLVDYRLRWGIYESTPEPHWQGMNTVKRNSDRRIPRTKFRESRRFPRANWSCDRRKEFSPANSQSFNPDLPNQKNKECSKFLISSLQIDVSSHIPQRCGKESIGKTTLVHALKTDWADSSQKGMELYEIFWTVLLSTFWAENSWPAWNSVLSTFWNLEKSIFENMDSVCQISITFRDASYEFAIFSLCQDIWPQNSPNVTTALLHCFGKPRKFAQT